MLNDEDDDEFDLEDSEDEDEEGDEEDDDEGGEEGPTDRDILKSFYEVSLSFLPFQSCSE